MSSVVKQPVAPGSSRRGARDGVDLEALLAGPPVYVGEEGLDVLGAVGRRVVADEGVLPHVHHEDGDEAADVARLVQRDPVVREPSVRRVLVADGPADAAHLADADEVGLPDVVGAERVLPA